MTPSIYINLEDDVSAIATRLKRERSKQIILVCPKRCFLFSDAINLKLLKTQADVLGKEVFILTMDEKGRSFAQLAGFGLRFLPKAGAAKIVSDIKIPEKEPDIKPIALPEVPAEDKQNILTRPVKELKKIARMLPWPKEDLPAQKQARPVEIPAAPLVTDTQIVLMPEQPEEAPEAAIKDAIFPKEIDDALQQEKKTKSNRSRVLLLLVSAVVVILCLVFLVLPKATVVIYPKTENVDRVLDISFGAAIPTADPSKLLLPAVKVNEALEAGDKFQSQGKKEVGNKAQGSVTIYNFTKLPVKLKSSTTTLTLADKTYSLVDDLVQIKPTLYKNAQTKEVDQSSLSGPIDIIATQGGENYNLPAGTRIEINNQVFGSKPQLLYAKTQVPIDGGVSRYLSVVSDQDTALAQDTLKQQLVSELRSRLAAQGLILLDNAFNTQVTGFTTDKPVGTESPTFQADLKIQIGGLALNKNDLSNLITDRIKETVSDKTTLLPVNDVESTYKVTGFDLNAQAGVVDAHFEGKAVYNVDLSGLAAQLAGKTENQVGAILKTKTEIDRIDVTLAPSWQKTFPWIAKKIEIKVQD